MKTRKIAHALYWQKRLVSSNNLSTKINASQLKQQILTQLKYTIEQLKKSENFQNYSPFFSANLLSAPGTSLY